MAYNVISNATLWYCHHHLWDLARRPKLDRRWREAWDAYRTYNRLFADTVASSAPDGARVLVQDYHLSLVGGMLRHDRPDLRSVHFSHTPFADPGMLRALPTDAAGELLAGMAGYGACGFHTTRWEASFRAAYGDATLAAAAGVSAPPPTFVAGIGTDPDVLEAEASSASVAEADDELGRLVGDRHLIVRVDRVELSKNILRGLWAFEELLETRPRWREQVVLLALAYPSREGLADYLAYRSEVEHTAQRINAEWSTPDWRPVILDVADNRMRSVAALRRYDVLLVNPVRDGMNLVAKEGPVVNRSDGVVVLSREAGAFESLQDNVIGVNPFDVSETAAALDEALAMEPGRRRQLAASLRALVRSHTAADWFTQLLDAAAALAPE
jgi:trehalose 6-phosphate synthase